MLGRLFGSKKVPEDTKSDFVIEDDEDQDSAFIKSLRLNMSRMIAYAESADTVLQREVAEKLANEAVKAERQVQIVELGGLKLLIPLTKSTDAEVQRLAAHALANLSVNADNQQLMATEGAIQALVVLLDSEQMQTQRQSAKALANLGVNYSNKRKIAEAGGIPKLIRLSASSISIPVKIEAIAALANLAVNDQNEVQIEQHDGLRPIIEALITTLKAIESFSGPKDRDFNNAEELLAQCARALRNLSVNAANKRALLALDAAAPLTRLLEHSNERIVQQTRKALSNLANLDGPPQQGK